MESKSPHLAVQVLLMNNLVTSLCCLKRTQVKIHFSFNNVWLSAYNSWNSLKKTMLLISVSDSVFYEMPVELFHILKSDIYQNNLVSGEIEALFIAHRNLCKLQYSP